LESRSVNAWIPEKQKCVNLFQIQFWIETQNGLYLLSWVDFIAENLFHKINLNYLAFCHEPGIGLFIQNPSEQ